MQRHKKEFIHLFLLAKKWQVEFDFRLLWHHLHCLANLFRPPQSTGSGIFIPRHIVQKDELTGTLDQRSRYFLSRNSFERWKVLCTNIRVPAQNFLKPYALRCRLLSQLISILLDVVGRHIQRLNWACPIKISVNVPAIFSIGQCRFWSVEVLQNLYSLPCVICISITSNLSK